MNLPADLFSPSWRWSAGLIALFALSWAVRKAPWPRLMHPDEGSQRNLVFGFAVIVALMWSMKAGIQAGLSLHLLGAMAATLVMGAPLALLAMALSLTGLALNAGIDWSAWTINYALMVVWPVCVACAIRRFVERYLPPHFFIFIFVQAFVGSALCVVAVGLGTSVVLAAAGAYDWHVLASEYLPYVMLLSFAEAWISGAMVTLLVVYKPEWVAAFDDRRYLAGK